MDLPRVPLDKLSDPKMRKRVRDSPAPVIVVSGGDSAEKHVAERWAVELGALVCFESTDETDAE